MDFRKILIYLCLMFVVMLSGCAQKTRPILQIDGQPVSDKVVSLKIFDLELRIKYQLVKRFKIIEGDESYEFRDYLAVNNEELHKVEDGEDLAMDIILFNPLKSHFKIVQHVITEDGIELTGHEYDGDISRKVMNIHLPRAKGRTEWYFEVLDSKDKVRYQSFKVVYQYLVYDKDYDG